MAISITHTTAADGTFSATGATEWNRAHSVSGATQYGVFYAATTTSIDQAAGFTFGGSAAGTGLQLGDLGTAVTDVPAFSFTRTNNNAAIATGVKWTYINTAASGSFKALQILGGLSGTTNWFSVDTNGICLGLVVEASAYFECQSVSGYYASSNTSSGYKLGASGTTNLSWISNGLIGVGTGAQGSFAGGMKMTTLTMDGLAITKGYTVATLPAGVTGGIVHVTDQLTTVAAKGVAPTGGGAVVCAVIYNGAAWVGI